MGRDDASVVDREEDVFRHHGADYMQRKTAMKADYVGQPRSGAENPSMLPKNSNPKHLLGHQLLPSRQRDAKTKT